MRSCRGHLKSDEQEIAFGKLENCEYIDRYVCDSVRLLMKFHVILNNILYDLI